jgi:hypothetical protein
MRRSSAAAADIATLNSDEKAPGADAFGGFLCGSVIANAAKQSRKQQGKVWIASLRSQ